MARTKRPGKATGAPKGASGKKGAAPAAGDSSAPKVAAPSEVASEQQRREAMTRLIDAHKASKLADKSASSGKGKYRAAFKEAMKFTGFTDRGLSNFMADLGRDPQDIDAETRETTAVHLFMETPIGAQLGTLDDGRSVASQRSGEKDAVQDNDTQSQVAAAAQGYQAGLDGDNFNSNPYPAGSKRAAKWGGDWKRGQEARGKEMGDKAAGGKSPTHEPAHA